MAGQRALASYAYEEALDQFTRVLDAKGSDQMDAKPRGRNPRQLQNVTVWNHVVPVAPNMAMLEVDERGEDL